MKKFDLVYIVQNNKALAKRADQLGAGLLDLDGYACRLAEVTLRHSTKMAYFGLRREQRSFWTISKKIATFLMRLNHNLHKKSKSIWHLWNSNAGYRVWAATRSFEAAFFVFRASQICVLTAKLRRDIIFM